MVRAQRKRGALVAAGSIGGLGGDSGERRGVARPEQIPEMGG